MKRWGFGIRPGWDTRKEKQFPLEMVMKHDKSHILLLEKSPWFCEFECGRPGLQIWGLGAKVFLGALSPQTENCGWLKHSCKLVGWVRFNGFMLTRAWLTYQVAGSTKQIWGPLIYLSKLDSVEGRKKKRRFYKYYRKNVYFLF